MQTIRIHDNTLQFILSQDKHQATIMDMFVQEDQRGKGVGSQLLQKCLNMLPNTVQTVEVDDMSDRQRLPHNIYLKHGFQYVHEFGPEMILRLNQ